MTNYTVFYSHSNQHGLHTHLEAENEKAMLATFETDYPGCRIQSYFPHDKKEVPIKEEAPHKEGKQHGS